MSDAKKVLEYVYTPGLIALGTGALGYASNMIWGRSGTGFIPTAAGALASGVLVKYLEDREIIPKKPFPKL